MLQLEGLNRVVQQPLVLGQGVVHDEHGSVLLQVEITAGLWILATKHGTYVYSSCERLLTRSRPYGRSLSKSS